MENLGKSLIEQLNCKTVFTIPLFGGIPVLESVVVTWIIMAVIIISSLLLVHGLKVRQINNKQAALEGSLSFLFDFFESFVGENGSSYISYLITLMVYLAVANMIGLLGFKSPTKDLNVTISLALMSIIVAQVAGIRKKSFKGWAKSLTEPLPAATPMNILELLIRPLSLCMRLFGNVLGAMVIMELIKGVVPLIVPLPFNFYFDIFDGVIQAYVFVFLTSLYIKEAVED